MFDFYKGGKVCFYPSSGFSLLWAVMELDCDFFIFTDNYPLGDRWELIESDFYRHKKIPTLIAQGEKYLFFEYGGKYAISYTENNNTTLKRLKQFDIRINHFVGICDGCCEGGNHECVHERPFLSRLLMVADQEMRYTTDHSRPLERPQYSRWSTTPLRKKFLSHVRWSEFPEPPFQSGAGPDLYEQVVDNPQFFLRGVLVAPDHDHHQKLRARDLKVVLYHADATELEKLAPFRTIGHRGILAEYFVS